MMLYGNYTIGYMKEETYRPLPPSLTIKRSRVDGLGLFATNDIKARTELGVTHIDLWRYWIRTPLGGFINHSTHPNCYTIEIIHDDAKFRVLYTLRDINKDEELLICYSLDEYKDKISNFK